MHFVKAKVREVQHGIDCCDPTRYHGFRLDHEHTGGSHHGESVCTVRVEDVTSFTFENPTAAISACRDTAVHRGTGAILRDPITNQGCELGHCRQEGRRVTGAPEFFEQERELDKAFSAAEFRPALVEVPLPKRVGVGVALRDRTDKGGWALLGQRAPDRFAPKALVIV